MTTTHRAPWGEMTADIGETFWKRINITGPDDCWEWKKGRTTDGYGSLKYNGKIGYAHRLAWELTHGPIPKGMDVCHSCDNPPCCNPVHLFLGTRKDNVNDALGKNRGSYYRPGEGSRNAKLTNRKVDEIRRRYKSEKTAHLAKEFGVSRAQIYRIGNGMRWVHLLKKG